MNSVTEKQIDHIKRLSSYPSTEKEDRLDIENFLKQNGKTTIDQLSKQKASDLIQILLKRPTEYEFTCGKTDILDRREVNRISALGKMEGCLHFCPDTTIGGNVHKCSYTDGQN